LTGIAAGRLHADGTVKTKSSTGSSQPADPSPAAKAQIKKPGKVAPPSHKDIAAQAARIWREKGCPKGRDDEIWLEAERQLTGKATPPSHKDIAAQAVKIWREKGCPKGRDDEIWLEARQQVTDRHQQRLEEGRKGPSPSPTDFSGSLMEELDEIFPLPAGRGAITSL
jgi:hypothetical protein